MFRFTICDGKMIIVNNENSPVERKEFTHERKIRENHE